MKISNTLFPATTLVLFALPLSLSAKNPHPEQPEPAPVVDYCDCSAFEVIADSDTVLLETLCDIQWTTPGTSWDKYGASLEYKANWMTSDSDLSAESEVDVDDYSCEFTEDEVCNADDVQLIVQDHPADANVYFWFRLKGFDKKNKDKDDGDGNGNGHAYGKYKDKNKDKNKNKGSRDYVKVNAECSIVDI